MAENSIQSTTQEYLDIHDITNDLVIMKDGTTSLILAVDAMNFGLLAEEEQDSIIYAYAGLLNSLNYPIQVLVKSKTKDVTAYLRLIQEQEQQADSPENRQRIRRYREFVSNLIHERNVLDKKFYVVIPAGPLELGLLSADSVIPGRQTFDVSSVERSVLLEKAKNILEPKRDHLISQFARIGLNSRQLTTQEIIQYFYVSYNPEAAEGQEIADSNSYSTPLVKASFEGIAMQNASDNPNQPASGGQAPNNQPAANNPPADQVNQPNQNNPAGRPGQQSSGGQQPQQVPQPQPGQQNQQRTSGQPQQPNQGQTNQAVNQPNQPTTQPTGQTTGQSTTQQNQGGSQPVQPPTTTNSNTAGPGSVQPPQPEGTAPMSQPANQQNQPNQPTQPNQVNTSNAPGTPTGNAVGNKNGHQGEPMNGAMEPQTLKKPTPSAEIPVEKSETIKKPTETETAQAQADDQKNEPEVVPTAEQTATPPNKTASQESQQNDTPKDPEQNAAQSEINATVGQLPQNETGQNGANSTKKQAVSQPGKTPQPGATPPENKSEEQNSLESNSNDNDSNTESDNNTDGDDTPPPIPEIN